MGLWFNSITTWHTYGVAEYYTYNWLVIWIDSGAIGACDGLVKKSYLMAINIQYEMINEPLPIPCELFWHGGEIIIESLTASGQNGQLAGQPGSERDFLCRYNKENCRPDYQ